MAVKKFKLIDEVVDHFQLSIQKVDFLSQIQTSNMPDALKTELQFALNDLPYKISEAAIRENVLYPVLKSVFLTGFEDRLMLWVGKSIAFGKELSAVPNYILAQQSARGKTIFGKPLLVVVEARKGNFEEAWVQCLLQMCIIQKMIGRTDLPVIGIVSNGDFWEFGKLEGSKFTANAHSFNISAFDIIFSTLFFSFQICHANSKEF
jgi:hypothetical protein